MAGTLFCKLLQRKTYDVLAKKHTILLLFVGFIVLFVSTLRFGETLITWSKEKYSVVFSPYSSNILGQNYRNMLCQYVPIDVVYTWVNGSDPEFLKELVKAKEDYGFISSNVNCSLLNCVKSHMVLVRPQLPSSVTLSDLEDLYPIFQNIENTFVVTLQQKRKDNVTVLVFPDEKTADTVVSMHMISVESGNHSLSPAFLTDTWAAQSTVQLNKLFVLRPLSSGTTHVNIQDKLPEEMRKYIEKVFIYEEKNLAVLSVSDAGTTESKLNNITFESQVVSVLPAYLVVEQPLEHEDISASRFTDNEELRYSLRSLERHAPWVQHVYIITNGQIPYWIDLDNPSLTIITHHELFPNTSHLPTFSSPAIECHLHRIPGLSPKFIYLNDDVLFGKDVWPEDFYTHTKGQKVYLSWPVPNCAEGCPSSWIRDGYCDKPCNNSQCQWDGGDCSQDNPLYPMQPQQVVGPTSYFRNTRNYCNTECADTWLADRYCDKACNVYECGYDAGDCGVDNFNKISQILLLEDQRHYYLPEGEHIGYFNLSALHAANLSIEEGLYEESPVVRALALSLKYGVIGIVLYPGHNATTVPILIKGEGKSFQKKIYLHALTKRSTILPSAAKGNETSSQTEGSFSFEEFQEKVRFPKLVTTQTGNAFSEFKYVNVSASHLPDNLTKEIENLESFRNAGILTVEGFLKKKSELISAYIESLKNSTHPAPVLVTEFPKIPNHYLNVTKDRNKINSSTKTIPPIPRIRNRFDYSESRGYGGKAFLLPKEMKPNVSLKDFFAGLSQVGKDTNRTKHVQPSPTQRHLLDTFGDSLRHVNKLYNEAFGYESRKVPSHIAHFVDRDVMTRLSNRFEYAFEVTSSHKFRSSDDMQFAFSYYYYMMSEMDTVEIGEIFDTFDVDKSGTWSDREMRTVLARLYDLPLDFNSVSGFEQILINCSIDKLSTVATHTEQYYESKMPLVSRDLVVGCGGISDLLLRQFGSRRRNAFEVAGEEEVAFKMIHNNLTQVLTQIDDLRKTPKKFVCLNDNMNHGTPEAEVIRAVVRDFYESLFPVRSRFELPPEYRNRFLRVSELREWRKTRDIIRVVTYVTLGTLILFSVYSFWRAEMRSGERYPRLRIIQNRNSHRV